MARGGKRQEPRFDDGEDDDWELRAERRPSPRARQARDAEEPDDFEAEATAKPKRRRSGSMIGALFYWAFTLSIWGVVGAGAIAVYYGSQLPPIDQLAVPKRPPNIAIMGSDGELLANRGDTGGAAIRILDLPPYLPKAFIAIEDRRFYSHWGVDPQGIARALLRNVTGHGGMQGGSTLTQQLAKNLFLTQERTISRKIQEAILALWLEHKYSKDQILELYLNRVYFGSGAYGVEAATQRYFGHSARTATLSESAVLAGLMKAPSKLAPDRNPEGATERAAQVITAMAQEGHISEAMAKAALAHPAQAAKGLGAGSANYAADYVMDMLDDTIGAIDQDLVVTTTIDPRLQAVAEGALKEELDKKGAKYGVSQGAIVSIDPNGAIRALVGGRDYSESQFNRAVSAKRQPGSAFKPFVYLAGLEHGMTPESVREDGPLNIKGWTPENYSHQYFGPVTLTKALALSLNTVAVRVGLEVGPKAVVKTAHRLGIQSDLQPNASIALGTSEVTPLELVAAYAPFANGGVGVQPHIITRVMTASGKTLYQRKGSTFGRVIEPHYVAMMNTMMQETLLTGTARKAELPGWQAAGKTGTSQDFRDAWFIGYTSRLVTGVWLGNDDSSPTKKASGGNLPVEIWSRYMSIALRGAPVAGLPTGSWRSDAEEVIAKPLDELIGIFTGADHQAAPAPPPRPQKQVAPLPPENRAAEERPLAPDETATIPPPPRGRASRPRDIEGLLPPEDIPDAGAVPPPNPRRGRAPAAAEKNIFEQLFGG
ncbi:penicillin-binding protein 1A [Methylocystis sp. MJC1]|jgi:penicillin-binding protein 1A|uniref:transglycosylase domain-containing protein n=1 Tax=Methylocystis sp. MJC1 TaxID=2654282 RepID=UPI0013EA0179|nr:penicillin-binding protein 1A [Methylocystis sp. MJC1]KAF2989579.1 Penicillin-binding protein 2D [Methylocystis sp. MJC1]MBU6528507.1 penicillin-binding protein 1A [Methylocystis sp. MJC1]UZX11405.1 penicillin-binding protein 1A [Methylocystis sp. MJC1]